MTSLLTILTAILALAFAGTALAFARGSTHASRLIWVCWAGSIVLFIVNTLLAKAPPFGNMRHVFCFFPMALVPAWLYLHRVQRINLGSYMAGAASIALIGALCMPMQATWRQMPALQSPWFVPHVTAYIISYGLNTVAFLLALRSYRSSQAEQRLHEADAVTYLAFPFMVFGLCSGAIWANDAWGRYWAWDIKEVWSLITCLVYLLYFHTSRHLPDWRRPLLILGFIAILITFLVVNLLPKISSVHSYAT